MSQLLKTIFIISLKAYGGLLLLLVLIIIILSIKYSPGKHVEGTPLHHLNKGFQNLNAHIHQGSFLNIFPFLMRRIFGFSRKREGVSPFPNPLPVPDLKEFSRNGNGVNWVGHSTLLFRMEGMTFLTDPMWSDRASPFSWYGPKRITRTPFPLDSLPPVDFVLISHDHYDHLDLETIKFLGKKGVYFFVPLGLKAWFADLGITKVTELDWGQQHKFGDFTITCVQAQHFSGRTPWVRNSRLWCGWVVVGKENRIYFAGDTGYFQNFPELGKQYGPFDVCCIPIGAYLPEIIMRPVHLNPEESIQAFKELGGKYFVPIHWGTFILSDEPVDEPPRRLSEAGTKEGIERDRLWIMKPGEVKRW